MNRMALARVPFVASILLATTASATPFAYIPNSGDNTVSVIDTATRTVVATIPVGGFPIGVAVDPAGHRAYVTNPNTDSVSAIDTTTNTVIAQNPVSRFPEGITIRPDGSRVWVATVGYPSAVVEIDTATHAVVRRTPVGLAAEGVTLNPAGTLLYVANQNDSTVQVLDAANGATHALIPVPEHPLFIAVSPDNQTVLVSSAARGSVTVINAATSQVVREIVLGKEAIELVYAPDGSRVYVVASSGTANSTIEEFDGRTLAHLASFPIESSPHGIDITPDGKQLYVACAAYNHVIVFDTATRAQVATINVGLHPFVIGRFIGGAPLLQQQAPTPAAVPIRTSTDVALALGLLLLAAAEIRRRRVDAG